MRLPVSVVAAFAVWCGGQLPSVAFAAPAPAASAAPSEADGVARAQRLFGARQFREAIAVLDAYIPSHPRDARALVLRGDAKASVDDNEGALRDYNAAIGIAPEYQYAYVTRCETRRDMGDDDGALADCDKAIALDATDPKAYEDRGDVFFERESYDKALADYDKAVKLGRGGAYVFAARCDAARLVGRTDAGSDCAKALAIDPKNRRALWANGRLALAQKRYTEAIGDFNAYVAQSPEKSDLGYYWRAVAYNRIGKYALALDDIQKYLAKSPQDADGLRERAIARYGTGDKSGAEQDLDAATREYRRQGDLQAADGIAAVKRALEAGQPIPQR